jgi:hypothetical protein
MRVLAAIVLGAVMSTGAMAFGENSGVGVGVCIPSGDLAEVNETSWYVQARSLSARKVVGWRAGTYYGDTTAHGSIDGGRVYGFDAEALARFGGRASFGYVFAGAGYGRLTFSRPGDLPGVVVRSSEWDWSMQGGVGVVINRKIYLEAMYVQFQTDPKSAFIPVVIGFQY